MKEKILFILLFIPFFAYSQKVAIAGEKLPVFGKFETYIVENHPKTNGGDATWRVVGGTFDGINTTTLSQSVEKNKVSVKWNETSSGSLYYNYEGYYGQIDVKPQKGSTEEPPPATGPKATIRVSGSNKTHYRVFFSAGYDLAGTVIKGSPAYKWTFNNAGVITTSTGSATSMVFSRIGQVEILLEVTVTTSGGHTIVTKATESISLVDGTLDTPNITGITGPTRLGPGSQGTYRAHYDYYFSNVKYEWRMRSIVLGGNTDIVDYQFDSADTYLFTCRATNTKTGITGLSASLRVVVDGNGPVMRSMSIPSTSFQIVNLNDAIVVSKVQIENDFEYVRTDNSEQISYQINNALTGILADQGKVINGNSIDISRLPKGIYVVTLNDGTTKEAHKISIK